MRTNYPYSRAYNTNILLVSKLKNFVRLQVFMAMTMRNAVSWGMKFIDVSNESICYQLRTSSFRINMLFPTSRLSWIPTDCWAQHPKDCFTRRLHFEGTVSHQVVFSVLIEPEMHRSCPLGRMSFSSYSSQQLADSLDGSVVKKGVWNSDRQVTH